MYLWDSEEVMYNYLLADAHKTAVLKNTNNF